MRDRKGYVAIIIACFIPVVMSLIYLSMHTTQSSTNRIIFENAVRQAALEAARNYMCGVPLADQKDYTERCAATTFNAAMKSLVGLENDVIPMKEQEIPYAYVEHPWFGYFQFSCDRQRVFYERWIRPEAIAEYYRTADPDADESEYIVAFSSSSGGFLRRTSALGSDAIIIDGGTKLVKKIFYRDAGNSNNTSFDIFENGNDNLRISVETRISSTGQKYKASFTATRPQLNADIVIGIPANNAAFLSSNEMYGSSVSLNDDTLQTPFYQIKAACKKFIREMLSFKNCGIGLIPYSGTVSLEEGKITTQSHGSYDYKNYAATNPQVPISESYKLSCEFLSGGPLTYKETALSYTTGIMHRADMITYNAGGDLVNTNVKDLLLSTVTKDTIFMAFPRYIVYGGHANIAAGYAPTYKRSEHIRLPMLGLTEKKLDIYRYCSFMSTFFTGMERHSSFVYLPVMFGMSMLDNGFMARDGYKVQDNGNKKILILFVNQPDLFYPRELTYFGYSNDASYLNLIDGDLLDYRNEVVYEGGYYMNKNQTTNYQKNTSIKCTYKKDETNGLYTLKMPQPANLKIIAEGTGGPCCVIYKNNGHGDIKVNKVEKTEGEGTIVVEDEQDGKAAYKVPVLQNGSSYTITVSGKYDCPVIVQLKLSGCELDMDDGATQGDHKWHIRQDEEYVYLCVGRIYGGTIDPNLYNSVFSTSVEIKLKIQSEPTQWQTLSYQGCYLAGTVFCSRDQHAGTYSNGNSTFDTGKIYNVKSFAYLSETTVEFTGSTHNLEADQGTKCISIRTYRKDSQYDNSTNQTDYVTFTREYGYTTGTSIPEYSAPINDMLQYVKLEPYTSDSIGPVKSGTYKLDIPYVQLSDINSKHYYSNNTQLHSINGKQYAFIDNTTDFHFAPTTDTFLLAQIKFYKCKPSATNYIRYKGNAIYIVPYGIRYYRFTPSTEGVGTGNSDTYISIYAEPTQEASITINQLSYHYFTHFNSSMNDYASKFGLQSENGYLISRLSHENINIDKEHPASIGGMIDPARDSTIKFLTVRGMNISITAQATYWGGPNTWAPEDACPSLTYNIGADENTCVISCHGYYDCGDCTRFHVGNLIDESIRNTVAMSWFRLTHNATEKAFTINNKSDMLSFDKFVYIYKYPGYYNTSESYATVYSVSKDGGNGIVTYDSANSRWICIPFGTLKLKITYSNTDVPVLARIECYNTKIDGYKSYLRTDPNYYFLCRNYNLGQYDSETITISEGSISAWRLSYASNILVGQSASSSDLGCRSTEYLRVKGLPDGYSYPTASTVNTPTSTNPYYICGTNVKATPFFKKTDEHSFVCSGIYEVSGKMNNLKVCAYADAKTAYIAFNCTQAKSNATNCSAKLGEIWFSCANKKTRKAADVKFNYFNMTGGTTAGYKLNNSYNSIYIPRDRINGTTNGTTINITLMNTKIIQIEWSNNLNGKEGARSVYSPDYHFTSSDTTPGTAWHENVKNAPYSKTNHYCSTSSYPTNILVTFKNYDGTTANWSEGRLFYNTLSFSLQNLLGDYNITWAGQEGTFGSIMKSTEFMTQYSGTYNNSPFSGTFNFGTSRHFQTSSADETNNKNNKNNNLNLTFKGYIRIKTIEATNELNRILFGAGYQKYDDAKSEPTIMPTEAMRSKLTPDIIEAFNNKFGDNGRIYVIHYRYKPEDYKKTGWDPENWGVERNYYNVTNETDLQSVLSEIMYEVKEFAGYQDAKIVAAE